MLPMHSMTTTAMEVMPVQEYFVFYCNATIYKHSCENQAKNTIFNCKSKRKTCRTLFCHLNFSHCLMYQALFSTLNLINFIRLIKCVKQEFSHCSPMQLFKYEKWGKNIKCLFQGMINSRR